jgi:cytidyltransferase-like protein
MKKSKKKAAIRKPISVSHTTSLFVGRWQPFHAGHKKLIETVLKKGKGVTIAIRDTEISHTNPYTVHERWVMIQRQLKKYGELVKIVVIPDIDEICYGREVGYKIHRIDLDEKTESISGTKTREKNMPMHPIIWLTGQSTAGKTTLGETLATKLGGVVLDGDEMRASISTDMTMSKEDRVLHNHRVARLAKVLSKRTPVVIAVIAPFEKLRAQVDAIIRPVWVYVKRKVPVTKERPYEAPKKYDVLADSDLFSPDENAEKVMDYLLKKNLLR